MDQYWYVQSPVNANLFTLNKPILSHSKSSQCKINRSIDFTLNGPIPARSKSLNPIKIEICNPKNTHYLDTLTKNVRRKMEHDNWTFEKMCGTQEQHDLHPKG
uniref:Uncharacterized protein n=1 Tax=viral metagenome TaxID=1070528 RepID=A0A6C0C9D4_9ZZZZ